MNKKLKLLLIILAAFIAIILGAVIIIFVSRAAAAAETPEPTAAATATPEPTPVPTAEHINTVSATIAAAGDVVMHTGLNSEASTGGGYDYTPIFGTVSENISAADYALCSLVTTFSDGTAYTAYPLFKSPDALASSLAAVGFDLVNTATSHAADSYKAGIGYTLNILDAAGLNHVGTYRSQEERDASSGVTYVDLNGILTAFLSYTCDTNQIPVTGFEYAVNICTTDYLSGASTINYDRISTDIAAAKAGGANAVIVLMSWGDEFSTTPNSMQTELADYIFEQGADIIIGGHCRVPQPMEYRTVTDIYGQEKTGFICYCLGNLISCQNDDYTDISAILNITLAKDTDTGETWISGVSYDPIYMVDLYDFGIDSLGWHYRLVDLHAAIDASDAGTPLDFVTDAIYSDMVLSLEETHEFFGAKFDARTD